MNKSKSILIYNKPIFKHLFQKIPPIKKLLYFCGSILDVYFAKVYNPPFYKNIIYIDPQNDKDFHKNKEEFIRKAWNSTLLNGTLVIPLEYSKYLESFKFKTLEINHKKYALYKKTENKLYVFYDKYRIVDFMIIGVEKAGTTSAMDNLSKHPDIFIAKPMDKHKGGEMHYYDFWWDEGKERYKSYFDYDYKLVGEKNPNLIYLDYVFPYIQKYNPCVKMILFLRNPIDRAYSDWHMLYVRLNGFMKNENRKTFQECVEDELENRLNESPNSYISYKHILQRGLYYRQIVKLLKFFPIQNICIITLDELKDEPKIMHKKIFDFLGVENIDLNYNIQFKGQYNKTNKNKDITPELRNKLVSFFKSDVKHLEKLLNKKLNWL